MKEGPGPGPGRASSDSTYAAVRLRLQTSVKDTKRDVSVLRSQLHTTSPSPTSSQTTSGTGPPSRDREPELEPNAAQPRNQSGPEPRLTSSSGPGHGTTPDAPLSHGSLGPRPGLVPVAWKQRLPAQLHTGARDVLRLHRDSPDVLLQLKHSKRSDATLGGLRVFL